MIKILLASAAVLATTTAASAGTIDLVEAINHKLLTTISISENSGKTYLGNVLAGQLQLKAIGGTDPIAGTLGTFLTYCIETDQRLGNGVGNVLSLNQGDNSRGGLGAVRAGEIAQLLGRFQPDLYAQQTNTVGAAIQIAIWAIADDAVGGSLNLTTGTFRVKAPAAILALSQSYLDSLTSPGPQLTNLYAVVFPKYQDVLVHTGPIKIVVPEPGVAGFLGLGLLGLIAARRRTRA